MIRTHSKSFWIDSFTADGVLGSLEIKNILYSTDYWWDSKMNFYTWQAHATGLHCRVRITSLQACVRSAWYSSTASFSDLKRNTAVRPRFLRRKPDVRYSITCWLEKIPTVDARTTSTSCTRGALVHSWSTPSSYVQYPMKCDIFRRSDHIVNPG
jgi:hypothetical protein